MKTNHLLIVAGILFIFILFRKPIKKGVTMVAEKLTRGYRNNNPGNIVLTFDSKKNKIFWQGEVNGTDKRFKTFKDMQHGYRAIFITLRSYIGKGFDTIEKILNRYAPPFENETNSYIGTVSKITGIPVDKKVSFAEPSEIRKIVEAISFVENGIKADPEQVLTGYNLFVKS